MATTTTTPAARPFAPRLWAQALYTIPRVDLAQVDPLTRWLVLSRVSVVVMSATSALIGGLLAVRGDAFDAPLLLLTAAGLVLAHTASNLVNDLWDFRRGVDTADSPRATYGPHALTHEAAPWRSFLAVTVLLLALCTAIGVYLVTVSGPGVLVFALAGAAVLLFYSGGPLPLKYFGLGELAVLVVWGPLMIGGTYYVMAEELPLWVVVASLPYGLGVTTVLFGKHLDKLEFDREHGIRTLPMLLGETLARRLTKALCLSMYAATLALAVWQEMPGLILVLGALPLWRLLWRWYSSPKPAEPPQGYRGWPLWFVGVAFIHNRRFGLLLVTGLAAQLIGEAIAGAV